MKKKDNENTDWTSVKLSKKLLKAGLNPDTASMYYTRYITDAMGKEIKRSKFYVAPHPYTEKSAIVCGHSKVEYLPCWTLTDLIGMMPKVKTTAYQAAYPRLERHSSLGKYYYESQVYGTLLYDTPIEAAVDMVYNLIKLKHIEK
jgi:hypothetical protein